MRTTVEINSMTTAEKLRTMEALWEDLCRKAGDRLEPPTWHRAVLKEREEAVRRGKDKAVEWETAKKNIRKAVS